MTLNARLLLFSPLTTTPGFVSAVASYYVIRIPVVVAKKQDACWCSELTAADPDVGQKSDPATILRRLPTRFDQSTHSGTGGFTDIMSIPPSVSSRAYQLVEDGADSNVYYVRRFISAGGGSDQYVSVLCRITGGGVRSPFPLTSVTVGYQPERTVLFVKPGETLPAEARTLRRRYTQIGAFNVFLPLTGKCTLTGPDPARFPTNIPGQYYVLLRIECTDDKEDDSDLAAVGAGPGDRGFLRRYFGSLKIVDQERQIASL